MSENTTDKGDMIVDGLGHVEEQAGGEKREIPENAHPTPVAQKREIPENGHPAPEQEDTFDRKYVEELRRENAKYRTRAGEAETLAQRLHAELVKADGRLQDPTDLPFNPEHLDTEGALDKAITELIEKKPHLKARRVAGDVGAGARGAASNDTDLIGLIRSLS